MEYIYINFSKISLHYANQAFFSSFVAKLLQNTCCGLSVSAVPVDELTLRNSFV